MSEVTYSVGLGIQSTVCILVGNEIGKGDTDGVKKQMRFVVKACLLVFICEICLIFLIKDKFLSFMTNNTKILDVARPLLPFFLINSFLELIRSGMIRGMLKGMNLFIKQLKYTLTG
jgi:Na+-driven multidrug efflux pump